MTSSYTPTTVNQGFNQEVPLNTNFTDIKAALDECLQRIQAVANAMESDLDMAGNQILNVPTPVDPTDLIRQKDVDSLAIEEVVQDIPYAATISLDTTAMTVARIALDGASTITLTGTPPDQKPLLILLKQDATGSRVVTWDGTRERFSIDVPFAQSTLADRIDYVVFRYNATDNKFDMLALNKGF